MASDVPVRDLRPLADWRDESGLDRLTAELIGGDLDAWWYDDATGEYHQIPRAHWRQQKAVVHAIAWGWPIGGLFSLSAPVRLCAIYAARCGPSKQPTQSRRGNKRAQDEVLRRVREAYPDGVGNTSSYAVHKRISGKGYNPSLDSVHRALGRGKK